MTGNRTAREVVLELLRRRSVRHIFGNPGTTELGLISGLPSDIEYVLCLQESIAVSAATGYALLGGRTAVVNLHALPGVGHAMGALHGAGLMHAPVVAIVGQQDSRHLASEPLLSGDVVGTARAATRWATQVARPEDVASAIERAFRAASTPPRGPALVAVPMDFWDGPAGAPVRVAEIPSAEPGPGPLDDLRSMLASSTNGALVTGDGVDDRSAWDAAISVAEAFDLDVYAAPIGTQPGFPTDHPRFGGNLPLVSGPLRSVLEAYDLVVVAGAPVFTTYLFDGTHAVPDDLKIALLSDDPDEAARGSGDLVVIGEPGVSLARLVDSDGSARGFQATTPTDPGRLEGLDLVSVMRHVAVVMPSDALLIDESMTSGTEVRRSVAVREPRQYLRTSNGVLGTGLPAAIGAAIGRPDRHVVAFLGDGSLMFAPQALWTAAQHDLQITVVVLDNGGYESLRGYERAHLPDRVNGSPAFDIPGIDLPALAEAMGVRGIDVATSRDLMPALTSAFGSRGPTVVVIRLGS
ncbi:MAG: thiamine pyrophosphate-binding protein [Acidimicrobiia bacterium]|nr:thiamine pyrophosphate-binding protein [Acidimicrobiia bacterium]